MSNPMTRQEQLEELIRECMFEPTPKMIATTARAINKLIEEATREARIDEWDFIDGVLEASNQEARDTMILNRDDRIQFLQNNKEKPNGTAKD